MQFCLETLGPAIYVDATTHTTHSNMVVYPLMATALPYGSALLVVVL